MSDDPHIREVRTFRLLPEREIEFTKPALVYRDADGAEHTALAWKSTPPEPELARKANDPGWWTITIALPLGATPIRLIPDPATDLF